MKKKLKGNALWETYPGAAKILWKMKLTLCVILISFFGGMASESYSQTTKLSLDLKSVKVKDALGAIENQSEFFFLYSEKLIDVNREVNIEVKGSTIEKILNKIFEGTDVNYSVKGRQIVLATPEANMTEATTFGTQQQKKSVSGKVTDSLGASLPGVSVVVKGTTSGVITDNDGKFQITVSDNSTLQFSFVGMKIQEFVIGSKTTINVTLEEDAIGLEEVVAIGYGTQKKATITGSIATVKGADLSKVPVTNMSNAMIGRLPGITSVQRSGEPGSDGSTILIRGKNTLGNNSPLVVVDGIPGRSLDRIDPNTIQSLTVLKDASAAIYGAQAGNGVILITTKRGEIGAPKITVNYNEGFNQPTRLPKMANSMEYATLLNEIDFYNNRQQRYTAEDIQKFGNGSDPLGHPNTNWFNEVLKPRSRQNYLNAAVEGGSEKIKYYLSLGSKFQDGYFYNSSSNFKQYDFLSNVDGTISKNVSIRFDVSGRLEDKNSPNTGVTNIFGTLMRGFPTKRAYWPNGLPGPDNDRSQPVVQSTDATGYNRDKRYSIFTNLMLDIKIPWIKGLSFTGNASLDKSFRFQKQWDQPWFVYYWDGFSMDKNTNPILAKVKRGVSDARLQQWANEDQKILINGIFSYENTIGKNAFKVIAGMESQKGESAGFSAFRRYFISTAIDELFAGGDIEKDNTGSAAESARLNYFGRFNYNYNQKLLLEFVWRYDGSYIFPQKGRYGFFPGISAGYRLSEEEFWKRNFSFIENFKLRASWGQTGNDRINEWQYLSSFGFRTNTYVLGTNVENKLLSESRIPNENVTWEVANQANIGFEARLLNDKLFFEFDYFNNRRSQILWQRNASVPTSTGLTLPRENIGKVDNTGFEFNTGYQNSFHKIRYSVSLNGSYAKNKIVFWDETPGVPDYQKSTGRPMDSELYYQAKGIFKNQAAVDAYPHWNGARPGDVIFEDVNNDKQINGLDRVRNKKSNIPPFNAGLQLSLGYGQFDFSLLFQGAFGAQRYLETYSGEQGNFLKEFYDNRWTETNTDASQPRAYNRSQEYWRTQRNTQWLRNTDYVRIKDLQVGYSLPNGIVNKLGIQALRVYVSGYNLLTFSPGFKDFDPESDSYDGSSYPVQKVINGGLTLTF